MDDGNEGIPAHDKRKQRVPTRDNENSTFQPVQKQVGFFQL